MAFVSRTTSSEPFSLAARFAHWQRGRHRALVPYITAGYPTPDTTPLLLDALADAGADVIELGVPFSDPVADGPTIQRSSQVALENGTNLETTLEMLAAFRARRDTAVVLFTYLNPVLRYGTERFLEVAARAGAHGVLITDLPLGGDPALETAIEESRLSLIRLIAPTTSPERARDIARRAQGFLYYIARMGVTGAAADLRATLGSELEALRAETTVPIVVGFGISTPEQVRAVARVADGVVVGSALIDALDRGGVKEVASFAGSLRRALDSAASR